MKIISFSNYARLIIQKHTFAFLKEYPGVLKAHDLEYLHRMRIASRRIRNSLWITKTLFKPSDYKYFRKKFRLVTRALGQARDLDTYIAFLLSLQKKSRQPQVKIILNASLKQARADRLVLQKFVVSALNRFEKQDVKEKLTKVLKDFLIQQEVDLNKIIEKKVSKCLGEFHQHESSIHSFKNQLELHQLRIAAKHLRYTLENFKVLYGAKLNLFISSARLIQAHLGDMRNQLIWKTELKQLKTSKKHESFISALTTQCEDSAQSSYQKFIRAYENQKKLRIWNQLKTLLNKTK